MSSSSIKIHRKKIVVVGDGYCGKTCLLMSFVYKQMEANLNETNIKKHKHLFDNYIPTVFETNITSLDYDDKQVQLALWDTAGTDDFDRLRAMSYAKCDVIIICFSIDSPKSMQNVIRKWEPEIQRYCPGVPIVLVGNKCDLRNNIRTNNNDEQNDGQSKHLHSLAPVTLMVTTEQGKLLAQKIQATNYVECSAKTGHGIQDVFEMVTKASFKSTETKRKSNQFKNHKIKNQNKHLTCNII